MDVFNQPDVAFDVAQALGPFSEVLDFFYFLALCWVGVTLIKALAGGYRRTPKEFTLKLEKKDAKHPALQGSGSQPTKINPAWRKRGA